MKTREPTRKSRGLSLPAWLLTAAVLLAVIGLFALHQPPTVSAHYFWLDCPDDPVNEGDSFWVDVIREEEHIVGSNWGVLWDTVSRTAGRKDYTSVLEWQYADDHDSEWDNRMGRRFHTTQDDEIEGEEQLEISFSDTYHQNSFHRNEVPHRSCTITIADDDPGWVTGTSIVSTPSNGEAYQAGEVIDLWISFNAPVTVTGRPGASLWLSGSDDPEDREWRGAYYRAWTDREKELDVVGFSNYVVRFSYTVKPGDLDSDGVSIGGKDENGLGRDMIKITGTDTNANQRFSGTEDLSEHRIDGRPRITGIEMVSGPAGGDTYGLGESIEFAVSFNQEMDATWAPASA